MASDHEYAREMTERISILGFGCGRRGGLKEVLGCQGVLLHNEQFVAQGLRVEVPCG